MKSVYLSSFAALALLSAAAPGQADDLSIATGNSLKLWCDGEGDDSTETAIMLSLCRGYIAGSFEAIWSMSIMAGNQESCDMTAVTDEQITEMVKSYILLHPSEWHKPAFLMVLGSARKAFPDCFGEEA